VASKRECSPDAIAPSALHSLDETMLYVHVAEAHLRELTLAPCAGVGVTKDRSVVSHVGNIATRSACASGITSGGGAPTL
jgi:hypothetical protein